VICGTDSIDITFVDVLAASASIEDWLPGMGLITSVTVFEWIGIV
jgi:hypothetical protein